METHDRIDFKFIKRSIPNLSIRYGIRRASTPCRKLIYSAFVAAVLCLITIGLANINRNYLIEMQVEPRHTTVNFSPNIEAGLLTQLRRQSRDQYRYQRKQIRIQILENIAVLRSRKFLTEFIKTNNILRLIYAERWNADTGEWIKKESNLISQFLSKISRVIFTKERNNTETQNNQPSIQRAVKVLETRIRYELDHTSRLVKIQMNWKDPYAGSEMLNSIVVYGNEYLATNKREQITQDIDRMLTNLQNDKESLWVRQSMLQQLEKLNFELVLNSSNFNKRFTILSPAIPPSSPTFNIPDRYLLVSAVLGFCISLLYFYIRDPDQF